VIPTVIATSKAGHTEGVEEQGQAAATDCVQTDKLSPPIKREQ